MQMNRRLFGLSAAAATLVGTAKPSLAASASSREFAAPRDPVLSYEGRTADMGDNVVRLGFPGVVVRVRFHGPRLILKTTASTDNLYVDIRIDGAAPKLVHLSKRAQDLLVYDGPSGEHIAEIARRNESWEGVSDVLGAIVPNGRFLPPPTLPSKKLLFIGDSITCGAACDVARDDPREDMSIHDAQKSYGKLLATRLDAQCHLVSCGGRGLIRDWQNIRTGINAQQFYGLAAPDEPSKPWNAASYVPDAVGIMLGTNDFNPGIPDQVEYVSTFVAFVQNIQADAPHAPIFLIDSPIVTDGDLPKRTVLGDYLDQVVRQVKSPTVSHAAIKHYAGRPGNGHPIAEDHVDIANELEPLFRKALA